MTQGRFILHLWVFTETSWAEFTQSNPHSGFLIRLIGLTISVFLVFVLINEELFFKKKKLFCEQR